MRHLFEPGDGYSEFGQAYDWRVQRALAPIFDDAVDSKVSLRELVRLITDVSGSLAGERVPQTPQERMSKTHYTTPEGVVTTDVQVYLDSWKRLCEPIEKALDVRVYGFDPTLAICPTANRGGHSFDMPLWFTKTLSMKLREDAEIIETLRDQAPL